MSHPYFFGYGSLVNRATHAYPGAAPATARGWRRLWRHTRGRQSAILTAVPDPDSRIEGLVAAVPGADWTALDLREAAYDRVDASLHVLHELGPVEVAIYTIPHDKHPPADRPAPILLSYLDVVVQGYLQVFGEDGARRFFDTTDGWEGAVLDDRAAPVYPRHQRLDPGERAFVDAQLAARGATILRG